MRFLTRMYLTFLKRLLPASKHDIGWRHEFLMHRLDEISAPLLFSHVAALNRLRSIGWVPRTIFDIGAYQGDWSKQVSITFPNAEFVLFEANEDNELALSKGKHKYFISTLASENDLERSFFLTKKAGSIMTGSSLYRENTSSFDDENLVVRPKRTRRLDSLVSDQKLNYAQLIKLDVQGAELDVLNGAPTTLEKCAALVIETSLLNYNENAPLFGDVVAFLNERGFKCVDICQLHRTAELLTMQLDLLFVRDSLYQKYCAATGLSKTQRG